MVSWRADHSVLGSSSSDTDQASTQTTVTSAATRTAARNQGRRHSSMASRSSSTVAQPTSSTPATPSGTGTVAAGTSAADRATPNTHQTSGPVKRINSWAPASHTTHNTAAALPSTVIGAISGATARLAAAATRLTRPEMPATSGAVTTGAAHATARASPSGLGGAPPN